MEIVSLIIAILALVVSCVVGYFYLESVTDQAKKEYRENQPIMQMIKLSSMSHGNALTLFPTIRNVSKVPAYNCTLTLDGWEGNIAIGTSYPPGPKFQEHQLSIVLGHETPIRSKSITPAHLRLHYRDCWEHPYQVAYQVKQTKQGATSLYGVQIDMTNPNQTCPNPGYCEIRKLLKSLPSRLL